MMSVEQEAHAGMFLRRALEFILAGAVLLLGLGVLLLEGIWAHPVYSVLEKVAPTAVWGVAFTLIGTIRCVVLVINGFWPFSPPVRLGLAILTLVFAWFPLATSYLAYFRLYISDGGGGFLPGLILTGVAVMTEGLCLYALSALRQAGRNVR